MNPTITGVILAGGQGSRMGGVDKGLLEVNGQVVIEQILQVLKPQVANILINANRNIERYQSYGYPVIQDELLGFQGPLAGIAVALQKASTEYVLILPCDSPTLAPDIAQHLLQTLQNEAAEIAVAHDGERLQPIHAVISRHLLPSLLEFLEQGERKVDLWYAKHKMAVADFSNCRTMFFNMNTPADKVALEKRTLVPASSTAVKSSVMSPTMVSTIQSTPSCADARDPTSLTVEQARARIMDGLLPVQPFIKRPLRDTLGQVLAQDVISPLNVPNHTNSAMDGYALRGNNLPVEGVCTYKVVGTALAGKPFEGSCGQGECVRIMTGAVMPQGLDTVVMQEKAELLSDQQVRIGTGHKAGQNVRQAGEDIAQGSVLLKAGQRISPADLGVIASVGIAELPVHRPLRVAFFSTGDELRSLGETLKQGQVYDSNRYTLYGLLKRLQFDILDLGVIKDVPALLETTLLQAAEAADVVITSGGVSVGEADYIKALLNKLGVINFWKIAIKPGRPLAFGRLGKAHFFGLPGNPVAVMVTFLQFVQPALLKLSGQSNYEPVLIDAISQDRLKKNAGRTEFIRGVVSRNAEGKLVVAKTGLQGSGILTSMSQANALIILPSERETVQVGEVVQVQLLPWEC